ncbi:hypothetical protein AAP_03747 [Ascosphaera apis ARSEF 7405]|uniref:Uncharacterized protein n=1 Tax=Ascosphaera apis ARSEF 7405 TaxID=392613 RepID=A0A167XZ13_9EURO|nr:hypothetical protein AAP_03747 [Ascosphaera apis ARSEF 7405]
MSLVTKRAKLLTGGMTVAIITGSLYGAGLKSRSEQNQKAEKERQQSPAEALNVLQIARDELVVKRNRLEKQIQNVKIRQAKRKAEQTMSKPQNG